MSAAAADAGDEGFDDVALLMLGQCAGVGVDQDDDLAGAAGGGEWAAEVAVEAALVAPYGAAGEGLGLDAQPVAVPLSRGGGRHHLLQLRRGKQLSGEQRGVEARDVRCGR